MSACEICWTRASLRSLLGGGHTAELYREELDRWPEGHEPKPEPK